MQLQRRRPGINREFGSENILQKGDLEDRKEDEWKDNIKANITAVSFKVGK
jgi:hypothetical protein